LYQLEINRISIKASEYAIPNEIEKILGEMGGTNLNAGTSNEEIVYFNIFPSNQIEKWLDVYSHRFIHPVYRLFQSELETVYEEYNMYKDDRFSNAFEEYSRAVYPTHPYGVPVLGYPDDLKNPSLKNRSMISQGNSPPFCPCSEHPGKPPGPSTHFPEIHKGLPDSSNCRRSLKSFQCPR